MFKQQRAKEISIEGIAPNSRYNKFNNRTNAFTKPSSMGVNMNSNSQEYFQITIFQSDGQHFT